MNSKRNAILSVSNMNCDTHNQIKKSTCPLIKTSRRTICFSSLSHTHTHTHTHTHYNVLTLLAIIYILHRLPNTKTKTLQLLLPMKRVHHSVCSDPYDQRVVLAFGEPVWRFGKALGW